MPHKGFVIHWVGVKNAHNSSRDKWLFTGLQCPRIEELFLAHILKQACSCYEGFAKLLDWLNEMSAVEKCLIRMYDPLISTVVKLYPGDSA